MEELFSKVIVKRNKILEDLERAREIEETEEEIFIREPFCEEDFCIVIKE